MTLIAALTPDVGLLRVDGAVNGGVFAAYLNQVPGPTLRSGDEVMLYSPDFNPVELAFTKRKN